MRDAEDQQREIDKKLISDFEQELLGLLRPGILLARPNGVRDWARINDKSVIQYYEFSDEFDRTHGSGENPFAELSSWLRKQRQRLKYYDNVFLNLLDMAIILRRREIVEAFVRSFPDDIQCVIDGLFIPGAYDPTVIIGRINLDLKLITHNGSLLELAAENDHRDLVEYLLNSNTIELKTEFDFVRLTHEGLREQKKLYNPHRIYGGISAIVKVDGAFNDPVLTRRVIEKYLQNLTANELTNLSDEEKFIFRYILRKNNFADISNRYATALEYSRSQLLDSSVIAIAIPTGNNQQQNNLFLELLSETSAGKGIASRLSRAQDAVKNTTTMLYSYITAPATNTPPPTGPSKLTLKPNEKTDLVVKALHQGNSELALELFKRLDYSTDSERAFNVAQKCIAINCSDEITVLAVDAAINHPGEFSKAQTALCLAVDCIENNGPLEMFALLVKAALENTSNNAKPDLVGALIKSCIVNDNIEKYMNKLLAMLDSELFATYLIQFRQRIDNINEIERLQRHSAPLTKEQHQFKKDFDQQDRKVKLVELASISCLNNPELALQIFKILANQQEYALMFDLMSGWPLFISIFLPYEDQKNGLAQTLFGIIKSSDSQPNPHLMLLHAINNAVEAIPQEILTEKLESMGISIKRSAQDEDEEKIDLAATKETLAKFCAANPLAAAAPAARRPSA
jgi:hypothetical protein